MQENPETTQKKSKPVTERVALKPEALARLEKWIDQANNEFKGIKLKKADLVYWLVMSRPEDLNNRDLKQLKEEFFDEIQFMHWALRKMKEAKLRKQDLQLSELMLKDSSLGKSRSSSKSSKNKKLGQKGSQSLQNQISETTRETEGSAPFTTPGSSK